MDGYYDLRKKSPIDLNRDCVSFDNWIRSDEINGTCSMHPDGFPVFLNEAELLAYDEYRNSDPFGLKEELDTEFQQRRIKCTLDLLMDFSDGKKMKLLDLGCGQGHMVNLIKLRFSDFKIHAVDHSISAIKYAHQNFREINFAVADAFRLPYEDAYFDIVICNNIWEHVPDPVNLARSISRILKDEGALVISTPSRYRLANIVNLIKGKKTTLLNKYHITEYSVGQVKEQLEYSGFKVIRIISDPIRERKLAGRILKKLLTILFRLTGSHHILELTAFYLAIKLPLKT